MPLRRSEPDISDTARELLLAAVADSVGQIMCIRYYGGMEISTGGRNFIDDNSPRTAARWEGVIDELNKLDLSLVGARSAKCSLLLIRGMPLLNRWESHQQSNKWMNQNRNGSLLLVQVYSLPVNPAPLP